MTIKYEARQRNTWNRRAARGQRSIKEGLNARIGSTGGMDAEAAAHAPVGQQFAEVAECFETRLGQFAMRGKLGRDDAPQLRLIRFDAAASGGHA